MSLPPDTLMELMSLADGELEGEAKLRAEQRVAQSEEARRIVEGMREPHADALRAWLGEMMDRRAAEAGVDRIAEDVMARLEASRADGGGVVARIDGKGGRRESRARLAVAAVCAVTALAAGVAFFLGSGKKAGDEPRSPVASVGMPSVDTQAPPAAPPTGGVEVDEVDSPSRVISVFEIPGASVLGASAAAAAGAARPSSVVIWIEEPQ